VGLRHLRRRRARQGDRRPRGRRCRHPLPALPAALRPGQGRGAQRHRRLRGAGPRLGAQFPPQEALARWLRQFTDFLGAKRGLASALHSGDPAYEALPGYFHERLDPVLAALLAAGVAEGTVRADVSAQDLLRAVAHLSNPVPGQDRDFPQRMVAVLIDGLGVRAG
jgi:hypothetical protein